MGKQLRSTLLIMAKALKPATPDIALITRKDETAKQHQKAASNNVILGIPLLDTSWEGGVDIGHQYLCHYH